jgi:hypothetical protein
MGYHKEWVSTLAQNTRLRPSMFEVLIANFSREPPFFLCRLSYMRDSPPERPDRPRSELAWMVAAVSYFKIAI